MSLLAALYASARRNPAAPAFLTDDGPTSYESFLALIDTAERILRNHAIGRDDVVGISMAQSPLHCAAIMALARLGATSVPLHPELPRPLRRRIAAKFAVRTLIGDGDETGIDGVLRIELRGAAPDLDAAGLTPSEPEQDGGRGFRISLTSGTTGEAKGDRLTHDQMLDRIDKTMFGCDCDSASRLSPPDINSTMGLALVFGLLGLGGTVVLARSFRADDRLAAMRAHAVTHAFLSQWAATQMLDLLPEHGGALPALRHLRLVGGALSATTLAALRARATERLFLSYGLTELGPVSLATPDILARWPASTGKILPWVAVETVGDDGQALPAGQPGEIRVKVRGGPSAYWCDPLETARKFRDGWFHTGDLGRVGEDGLLFIEGRIDETINLGGYKINPLHVEDVLAGHPQVAQALAFAAADAGTPYLAAALVARTNRIDVADVARFAKRQLGWGAPRDYVILSEFARTPNGKPIRSAIVAAAMAARPSWVCPRV
jgi:acyl-CoA synthetase (AMP-forming)/AMP-acid ligase II